MSHFLEGVSWNTLQRSTFMTKVHAVLEASHRSQVTTLPVAEQWVRYCIVPRLDEVPDPGDKSVSWGEGEGPVHFRNKAQAVVEASRHGNVVPLDDALRYLEMCIIECHQVG